MTLEGEIKRYRALLAIANNVLQEKVANWTDDDYREVLRQHGATAKQGRISATTMTLDEMKKALKHFKKMGFTPKPRVKLSDWRSPRIAKLRAIWFEMSHKGLVKNGSPKALEAWCTANVQGLTKLQWATSEQLNKAIEMLKLFSERK